MASCVVALGWVDLTNVTCRKFIVWLCACSILKILYLRREVSRSSAFLSPFREICSTAKVVAYDELSAPVSCYASVLLCPMVQVRIIQLGFGLYTRYIQPCAGGTWLPATHAVYPCSFITYHISHFLHILAIAIE